MSAIFTVFVPDGIVIAADSRLTESKSGETDQLKTIIHFTSTDNAQKIFLLNNRNIGIAACGIMIIDGKTMGEYLDAFESEVCTTDDNVISISKKLGEYIGKREDMVFHICGYYDGNPYVYCLRDGRLERENVLAAENGKEICFGIISGGKEEAFNKLICAPPETNISYSTMPLKDAIDISEFFVDLTIKYERFRNELQCCGGDIDILVITKNDAFWYKNKLIKN